MRLARPQSDLIMGNAGLALSTDERILRCTRRLALAASQTRACWTQRRAPYRSRFHLTAVISYGLFEFRPSGLTVTPSPACGVENDDGNAPGDLRRPTHNDPPAAGARASRTRPINYVYRLCRNDSVSGCGTCWACWLRVGDTHLGGRPSSARRTYAPKGLAPKVRQYQS